MTLSGEQSQTYTYTGDKLVTVLLPLRKDPNQSVSRLYRCPAGKVKSPAHVASSTYKDIFILEQPDTYDGLNSTSGF